MATVYKFQLLHYIAASLSLPDFCGDYCLGLHVSAEPWASGLSVCSCSQDRLPSLVAFLGSCTHLEAKPAFALPVGTIGGKRAVALYLVSTVSVGWSGARLGIQQVMFIMAHLLEVCQAENKLWKSRGSSNTCRETRETGPLFFFTLPSSSKLLISF